MVKESMAKYKAYMVDGKRVDTFEVTDAHTSVYGVNKVIQNSSTSETSNNSIYCADEKSIRTATIIGIVAPICGFLMFVGIVAILWLLFSILF